MFILTAQQRQVQMVDQRQVQVCVEETFEEKSI